MARPEPVSPASPDASRDADGVWYAAPALAGADDPITISTAAHSASHSRVFSVAFMIAPFLSPAAGCDGRAIGPAQGASGPSLRGLQGWLSWISVGLIPIEVVRRD